MDIPNRYQLVREEPTCPVCGQPNTQNEPTDPILCLTCRRAEQARINQAQKEAEWARREQIRAEVWARVHRTQDTLNAWQPKKVTL